MIDIAFDELLDVLIDTAAVLGRNTLEIRLQFGREMDFHCYLGTETRGPRDGGRTTKDARDGGVNSPERGASWTYPTTDQLVGTWNERIMQGIVLK